MISIDGGGCGKGGGVYEAVTKPGAQRCAKKRRSEVENAIYRTYLGASAILVEAGDRKVS